MGFINWVKREYIIDSLMINTVLDLYTVMLVPHVMAVLSCMAVAT
jgi:hypothetical protein